MAACACSTGMPLSPDCPVHAIPTRRQIVFNWLMGEPDFATKVGGYWGGADDLKSVDDLLAALGLAAE